MCEAIVFDALASGLDYWHEIGRHKSSSPFLSNSQDKDARKRKKKTKKLYQRTKGSTKITRLGVCFACLAGHALKVLHVGRIAS